MMKINDEDWQGIEKGIIIPSRFFRRIGFPVEEFSFFEFQKRGKK